MATTRIITTMSVLVMFTWLVYLIFFEEVTVGYCNIKN